MCSQLNYINILNVNVLKSSIKIRVYQQFSVQKLNALLAKGLNISYSSSVSPNTEVPVGHRGPRSAG